MSGLLVPRHLAGAIAKQKVNVTPTEAVANSIVRSATNRLTSDEFASRKEVQKQLDQLQDHLATMRDEDGGYGLPKPSGWRITVLMLTISDVTEGGVHIVDEMREARSMASPQGIILAVGPAAYTDKTRFMVDGVLQPWHKPGDRIIWTRYDATTFQLANGQRIGFMNDTQPAGIIDDGWDVSFI
jgi:co-chaperonin GroES (HSP10)